MPIGVNQWAHLEANHARRVIPFHVTAKGFRQSRAWLFESLSSVFMLSNLLGCR